MAIELVEGGIGAPAFEPTEVGRIIGVEGAGPRHETGGQVGGDRRCAFGVPARPARLRFAQPGRSARDIDQPMQVSYSDLTVERTRIRQHVGTHGLPIGTGAHRIDTRDQHLDTRSSSGINHVHSAQPLPLARRRPANGQETVIEAALRVRLCRRQVVKGNFASHATFCPLWLGQACDRPYLTLGQPHQKAFVGSKTAPTVRTNI